MFQDPATYGQAPLTDEAFGGTMLTKILAQMLAEQAQARVEASEAFQKNATKENLDLFQGPMGGGQPQDPMMDPMAMMGMGGMGGMGGDPMGGMGQY